MPFDVSSVRRRDRGVCGEARSKLRDARPPTVGQAGWLDGPTPAAFDILAAYLRREERRKNSVATE
jgi:tRNA uridine 5-carboxymethylaminomethyl modification enzyme